MKRTVFFIVAVLYLSLVFAAGIKEVTNVTIPNTEYLNYNWDPNGSILTYRNLPGGADVRYIPPGFPPHSIITQTLPTDGADSVFFKPSYDNTDVFAVDVRHGPDHTIYGYKTGKKIVNTGEIHWNTNDIVGYQQTVWQDDTFFFITLTDPPGTINAHMYDKNFKQKMNATFEGNPDNYGFPPAWPSRHGRFIAIEPPQTVTATLDVDIYRTGRKPRFMGDLQTHGSIHWEGKKDNFIDHVKEFTPTGVVWEVDRIGSINKLGEINNLPYVLNTKGKGSVGVADKNQMISILSEKGIAGPYAVPEAATGDTVSVAHYYGNDMILFFNSPGNTRLCGYKVTKKGLKKKIGPETIPSLLIFNRVGKYLVTVQQNGTAYDHTVYSTKMKKIGTITLKNIAQVKLRSMATTTYDPTNTLFRIFTW